MADNPQLSAGTADGAIISGDDITVSGHSGTGVVQYIKLVDGTANGTEPVQIAGGTEANALRVTIANDSTGVVSVDDNGGVLTIQENAAMDVSAATVTVDLGANNDVTIDASSCVHVDDAGFTLGTDSGIMAMGFAGTQSVNANDAAALACDTDGALHISDGGNTITVDGTVTANPASGTIDTVTTVGTVTTVTNDVNIADGGNSITVDSGAAFTVQEDGAALTALQLIDDVVAIDDTTTHTTGATKGVSIMAAATPTDGSVAANDIGSVAMSTDRRLHVDADITASVSLDVSAATVTVDGTGTLVVQEDGAALTSLQIIDDWDESDRAKVNPIVGQAGVAAGAGAVGVTVQRTTLASDDPAVALLTTIDSDTNTIQSDTTAILADTDIIQSDTTSIDGKITACNTGAVVVTAVPRSISGDGEPGTAVDSYAHVAINLTTAADQVLVAGAPSKQIWVYGYGFTCGDADGQTVSLQDEDNVALTGIMEFAQYGGISVPPSGNFSMPIFKLGTDKDLEIDIGGGDVDGWLVYAILSV